MLGYPSKPTPPPWKILLYCVVTVAVVAGIGWLYAQFAGGRYDTAPSPSVVSVLPDAPTGE